MFGITDQAQFQLFLKAGRVLVSRIVAGRLFQVRGPATWKARSPILVVFLGTKTSDDFDNRIHDLYWKTTNTEDLCLVEMQTQKQHFNNRETFFVRIYCVTVIFCSKLIEVYSTLL